MSAATTTPIDNHPTPINPTATVSDNHPTPSTSAATASATPAVAARVQCRIGQNTKQCVHRVAKQCGRGLCASHCARAGGCHIHEAERDEDLAEIMEERARGVHCSRTSGMLV